MHMAGQIGYRFGCPAMYCKNRLITRFVCETAPYDLVHLTANTAPFLTFEWPPTVVTVHDVMYLMTRKELPSSPSIRHRLGRLYRWLAFYCGDGESRPPDCWLFPYGA